jgi:hypothetical protein
LAHKLLLFLTFVFKVPGFLKSQDHDLSDDQDYAIEPLEDTEDDAEEPMVKQKEFDESTECVTKKSRKKILPRNYHFCDHEGCNKKYANVNHLKVSTYTF